MNRINFIFNEVHFTLRNRRVLKGQLINILKKHGLKVSFISYIFCNDEFLLQINKQFLKHNYYTDIITFDLSDEPSEVKAEIYISLDSVKENARIHKSNYRDEVLRVMFHGILHLCGYKDKSEKEKIEMRRREDKEILLFKKNVSQNTVSE